MNLGPEFRLFCLALRQPPCAGDVRADDLAEMRRLAAAGPRWDALVRGARRHRVAAAVLRGLQACGTPHLPDDIANRLRMLSVANARRSLAQVAELRRLAQLFAAAGVRVLVLKGAALAAQLYGDAGARVARDIDLLVDPDQFACAQDVLAAAGYRQRPDLRSPRQYGGLSSFDQRPRICSCRFRQSGRTASPPPRQPEFAVGPVCRVVGRARGGRTFRRHD